MSERERLQTRLEDYVRNLYIVEDKVAKYTELEAPIHLIRQRDELQHKIEGLKARLAELDRLKVGLPGAKGEEAPLQVIADREGQKYSDLLDELDYEEIADEIAFLMEAERFSSIPLDEVDYQEIEKELKLERGITSLRHDVTSPLEEKKIILEGVKARIFISSTWADLQAEREAVERSVRRMRDTTLTGMEYFGSRPETPKEVCLEEVSRSSVYIGIFAHRYGSVDPDSGLSMTELEYRKAQECDIPCLIYMMDDSVPVLPVNIEREPEKVAKLTALKQELLSKHVVSFFSNPDDLAVKVVADLHNLFRR